MVSPEKLREKVFGYNILYTSTSNYISKLRKTLKPTSLGIELIHRLGYRLVEEGDVSVDDPLFPSIVINGNKISPGPKRDSLFRALEKACPNTLTEKHLGMITGTAEHSAPSVVININKKLFGTGTRIKNIRGQGYCLEKTEGGG